MPPLCELNLRRRQGSDNREEVMIPEGQQWGGKPHREMEKGPWDRGRRKGCPGAAMLGRASILHN